MNTTIAALPSVYADVNDLQQAISAAESSTLAIEAQIESLQSSQAFLLRNRQASNHDTHLEQSTRRQKELERQRLKSLNDELAVLLQTALSNSKDASTNAAQAASKATEQYLQLKTDLLTRLQAQSIGIFDSGHGLSRSKTNRPHDLLLALQQTLASKQQSRLDRVYLQHATDTSSASQAKPSSTGELNAPTEEISNDLNLLYAEIDDMTDMIVNHDHGNALRTTDAAIARAASFLEGLRMRKLLQSLTRIVEDTEQRATICRLLHSHRIFLGKVAVVTSSSASTEIATKLADVPENPDIHMRNKQNALEGLLRHLSLDAAQMPSSEPFQNPPASEYSRLARDVSAMVIAQSRSLSSSKEDPLYDDSKLARTDLLIEAFESSVTRAHRAME